MKTTPLCKSLFGPGQPSPCNDSKQSNPPRCKEKSHDVHPDLIKQAISTGDPEARTMQLRQTRSGSTLREYIVLELDVLIEGRVQLKRFQIESKPASRSAFSKNSQEHSSVGADILNPYIPEENGADPSECLFELLFRQLLPVSRIFKIWQVISKHAPHTPQFDSCFYARTLMLCVLCEQGAWHEEYIWKFARDGKPSTETRQPLENISIHSAHAMTVNIREPRSNSMTAAQGDRTPATSQQYELTKSDTGCLQRHLSKMIQEHSRPSTCWPRLWATRKAHLAAEREVKETINRIWKEIKGYLCRGF